MFTNSSLPSGFSGTNERVSLQTTLSGTQGDSWGSCSRPGIGLDNPDECLPGQHIP